MQQHSQALLKTLSALSWKCRTYHRWAAQRLSEVLNVAMAAMAPQLPWAASQSWLFAIL
jgi:hypothetical protein